MIEVTAAQLKDIITASMENTELAERIYKALEPFHGKRITKRMETALKAAFPEYSIYYQHEYSRFKITIWGGEIGRDHGNAWVFYLGDDITGDTFDKAEVWDSRYLKHALDRNKQRQAEIDAPGKLEALANAINHANKTFIIAQGFLEGMTDQTKIDAFLFCEERHRYRR